MLQLKAPIHHILDSIPVAGINQEFSDLLCSEQSMKKKNDL